MAENGRLEARFQSGRFLRESKRSKNVDEGLERIRGAAENVYIDAHDFLRKIIDIVQ
jgi:hypothetical protein